MALMAIVLLVQAGLVDLVVTMLPSAVGSDGSTSHWCCWGIVGGRVCCCLVTGGAMGRRGEGLGPREKGSPVRILDIHLLLPPRAGWTLGSCGCWCGGRWLAGAGAAGLCWGCHWSFHRILLKLFNFKLFSFILRCLKMCISPLAYTVLTLVYKQQWDYNKHFSHILMIL